MNKNLKAKVPAKPVSKSPSPALPGVSALRKPRADSKLKTLPLDRQAAIEEFARSHTVEQVIAWLRRSHHISTSARAVSEFLNWYHLSTLFDYQEEFVQMLLVEYRQRDPSLTAAKLDDIGQWFFSRLALVNQSPQIWNLTRQIAQGKEKLDLERNKQRELKAAREAALASESDKPTGAIKPETLEQIERELNLM